MRLSESEETTEADEGHAGSRFCRRFGRQHYERVTAAIFFPTKDLLLSEKPDEPTAIRANIAATF